MSRGFERTGGYLPIAAYGVIGDCRSAALVGSDGSIDWLSLPRFDDASLFGRILDARKGGSWQIRPAVPYRASQRYRDRTNVLITIFSTDGGVVAVTDFMPVQPETLGHHARPHSEPRVVRLIECVAGSVPMRMEIDVAPGYGLQRPVFRCTGRRWHTNAAGLHICFLSTLDIQGRFTRFRLHAGESAVVALRTDQAGTCRGHAERHEVDHARALLRETSEFWWRWVDQCRYTGPYVQPVTRSALALKLMQYAPTGAIVAAPTTSLPERIGGIRNWDYRYTWLRDASFTLFALFQIGMHDEAHAFYRWLERIPLASRQNGLANLFTLDGSDETPESTLEHLSGYRGSRPVRIGNGAVHQLQLDVYGELLDSAYLYARFGGTVDRTLWKDLRRVVELAIAHWDLPDASIWEVRGEQRHYVYSKMMCWVAVDRGLRLAERFGLPHDAQRWRAARAAIHRRVTAEGFNKRRRSYTQSLGDTNLDAALLRMTQVRFLRDRDPRLRSTVEAIAHELGEGPLVRRYSTQQAKDGLHGTEGAFLLCSFWLVDAWAHLGELEKAQIAFERLLTFASPLGLFAEEADPRTGEQLGNFPQAFTHLALIGAAVNIERLRHRRIGKRGLR